MIRTLGGERLGGGKKMQVEMHGYSRSTHNLSEAFRSSMSAGTLVPFFKKVALPGDTFDLAVHAEVLTLPTNGPLFGSYQLQIDYFLTPIRLYNADLHMNMLGIGLRMQDVTLPQIQIKGLTPNNKFGNINNIQINPSSIMKYLGVSGTGENPEAEDLIARNFNAVPLLAYWDIYKNYYANKMEEIGMMIHKAQYPSGLTITAASFVGGTPSPQALDITDPYTNTPIIVSDGPMYMTITMSDLTNAVPLENFEVGVEGLLGEPFWRPATEIFSDWQYDPENNRLIGYGTFIFLPIPGATANIRGVRYRENTVKDGYPQIFQFPLENIDNMKLAILRATAPIVITPEFPGYAPYSNILEGEDETNPEDSDFALTYTQEGLGLRTYKSDIFNNWLNTEFIEGTGSIADITKVSTAGNSFTIDALNMSKKLYDMLNRIVASGGSYDDWLDATYTEDRTRSAESPMYMGGLIQDIIFTPVVSTARTENTPLGELAGRGRNGDNKKGGSVVIKAEEPSYIMGIVSIVPLIDYCQGNDWDMSLRTLNDLHKPALDEIGFQDLITDQMAWWDTRVDTADELQYKSAGKQPAWVNYMTSYNKVYGTFADENQQMFMVLARRYEAGYGTDDSRRIDDLTTYVDPSKFNHIFADARLDAQNFWVQIGTKVEARRKMSAKIMPNL